MLGLPRISTRIMVTESGSLRWSFDYCVRGTPCGCSEWLRRASEKEKKILNNQLFEILNSPALMFLVDAVGNRAALF